MVVARVDRIDQELRARRLLHIELAGLMRMSQNTVANILAGRPVGSNAQAALYRAFDGEVPMDELFELVVDDGTETEDGAEGEAA
ncbi:MAG: hypothetical protein BWY85_01014 [Firmicutes bacterium ADurb.Bin506]|jgi:transcriptional regulator with XRE-family HTH domain|nr:MAG: hypothetical protein BWY85_01014 [Firmicutes bacterium ADurb.Bin506]